MQKEEKREERTQGSSTVFYFNIKSHFLSTIPSSPYISEVTTNMRFSSLLDFTDTEGSSCAYRLVTDHRQHLHCVPVDSQTKGMDKVTLVIMIKEPSKEPSFQIYMLNVLTFRTS